jgi:hypothetical protein
MRLRLEQFHEVQRTKSFGRASPQCFVITKTLAGNSGTLGVRNIMTRDAPGRTSRAEQPSQTFQFLGSPKLTVYPLYPRQQTSPSAVSMAALCQKRSASVQGD